MAPTSTNSATAIGMIYPELLGKLNGHAVRIPLQYASITVRTHSRRCRRRRRCCRCIHAWLTAAVFLRRQDLTFEVGRATTADEINAAMKVASESAPLAG